MDEPVDAVRHDDLLQVLEVQDVGEDERACEMEDSDVEKNKVEKMCIVEFKRIVVVHLATTLGSYLVISSGTDRRY